MRFFPPYDHPGPWFGRHLSRLIENCVFRQGDTMDWLMATPRWFRTLVWKAFHVRRWYVPYDFKITTPRIGHWEILRIYRAGKRDWYVEKRWVPVRSSRVPSSDRVQGSDHRDHLTRRRGHIRGNSHSIITMAKLVHDANQLTLEALKLIQNGDLAGARMLTDGVTGRELEQILGHLEALTDMMCRAKPKAKPPNEPDA